MGINASGAGDTGRADSGPASQALFGVYWRQAVSEGSLLPTGWVAPAPSGDRGVTREGERIRTHTQAVGWGGGGVMLKVYQERIRRRDSEGRGGGATVSVGKISVAALQKGLVIVT